MAIKLAEFLSCISSQNAIICSKVNRSSLSLSLSLYTYIYIYIYIYISVTFKEILPEDEGRRFLGKYSKFLPGYMGSYLNEKYCLLRCNAV
jgi:hypothetical protein